ncbi:TPA: hypothetical protein LVM12_002486 [Klebsiella oxytoca]|nr:hypothetical protein [Klebsiella oxytoca]
MTPNLIAKYFSTRNFDIRQSGNGRWIDQKCALDSVCFVADCVVEYLREGGIQPFHSPDIWRSEYAVRSVQLWFSKPDPLTPSTLDEYNKFFRQPLKMLCAADVLEEKLVGNSIEFSVKNMDILEFISIRERNAYEFLCLYIEKTLKDSGLWDSFETFFDEQTNESLQYLKSKFAEFCIKYTKINTHVEANRIFIKVLNPLACKYKLKGTLGGRISPSFITFDVIFYNQPNWRDVRAGKAKNIARGDFTPPSESPQLYQYKVSRAAKNLRQFNDKYNNGRSEITDRFSIGEKATHMHHIFPRHQFPEIADFIENLIALTSGQHLQCAHPAGNTKVINKDYQYICLVNKTESIRKNLLEDEEKNIIYNFFDFLKVLDTGLMTDYFQRIGENDFSAIVHGIEINF